MSKSIGKIFGTGSNGTYGYERNYMNYLNNYNTSNYDNTLNNMTSTAYNMSNNLDMMPQYQFGVDYSDAARQRAENATYNSYVDRLQPQYQQMTNDLQSNLINQGIPVGSVAYNRAMQSLQDRQIAGLNQAAYQSVLNGQNAYSQSLSNNISSAQFNNAAQQNYINLIQSLLNGSVSGYDNNLNLYNLEHGITNRQEANQKSGWQNLGSILGAAGLAMGGIK